MGCGDVSTRRGLLSRQVGRGESSYRRMIMSATVITVPAFASARDEVRHFFGTRGHADSLTLDVGVPVRQSGAQGRSWLLSVKQVHGTDALVVDRPLSK